MSDLQKQYRVEAWDILQHIFKVNLINDHTLHFVAAFSSQIDLGRFKKAVAVSAEVFPFLGCRFNEQGRKPVWVSCADAIDKMVTLIETEQTDVAVRNFLCSEVDAFSGPQIKIGVIRDAGTDKIVILINQPFIHIKSVNKIDHLLGIEIHLTESILTHKIIELVIFIRMDITTYNWIFYIRTMAKYFLHILNKVFINNIKYF